METPFQCASRLLIALDELVAREGTFLRAGSFELAAKVRENAGPVVDRLVELSRIPEVAAMREKVAAIVARSHQHSVILEEKITEARAEIRRNDQARQRTSQLAPAYMRAPGAKNQRFVAAG